MLLDVNVREGSKISNHLFTMALVEKDVPAVDFHPTEQWLLTGLATVKIWNSCTYRLENTLSYVLEHARCVSARRGVNDVAVGFDEGVVAIKVR